MTERDTESGLDYFGARYYDHTLYRFLSVDPVVPADDALFSPEQWNLYQHCFNNPIVLMDQDGRAVEYFMITITRTFSGPTGTFGALQVGDKTIGYTIEPPWRNNMVNISCIPAEKTYNARFYMSPKFKRYVILLTKVPGRRLIEIHPGSRTITTAANTDGCILPVKGISGGGEGIGSHEAFDELMNSAVAYILMRYIAFWYMPIPQIQLKVRVLTGEVYTEVVSVVVYDENGNVVYVY